MLMKRGDIGCADPLVAALDRVAAFVDAHTLSSQDLIEVYPRGFGVTHYHLYRSDLRTLLTAVRAHQTVAGPSQPPPGSARKPASWSNSPGSPTTTGRGVPPVSTSDSETTR